jgi:hypothetical protein
MDPRHGTIVRVVVWIVGNEPFASASNIEHLVYSPQFAETHTP